MKKHSFLIALSLGILASQSCSSADTLSGKVTCDGEGIAGVVVSDGIDCVVTDDGGAFTLAKNRGARHVYISTPAGYTVPCEKSTIVKFYQKVEENKSKYNFELTKNELGDKKHMFLVQTDPQFTTVDNIARYSSEILDDMNKYLEPYRGKIDLFSIECGDMVGDSPALFPAYIDTVAKLNIPIYRELGNHDMTYGGRSFEYSFKTFEDYFGPSYYSFNKGDVHYIGINNCFYVNRDYQYIGYIDESILSWLEQDLSYVSKDKVIVVFMHIPANLSKEIKWNTLNADGTVNVRSLFDMLEGYNTHIMTGHTHFNLNVCFSENIFEHNTASTCGTWWKSSLCMDGTPAGYGVYTVDGTDIKWVYKSAGKPVEHQFRVYPVGSSKKFPRDVMANVWNYDDAWKVELLENGVATANMEICVDYDPESYAVCSNKAIVEYEWISPIPNAHMFHATPKNPRAELAVKVTDRFGNVYTEVIK